MRTNLPPDGEDRPGQARSQADRQTAADLGPALRAAALVARPRVGWLLAALGVVALVVAWVGVSDEIFVARQVPYIVSGGLGGVALIVLAGVLLGTHDLYRYADRLDRLEQKVDDIHRMLVVAWDDGAGPSTVGDASVVAVLPRGSSYHRPDCVAVQGKSVDHLPTQEAARAGLSPCKLCEPPEVTATLPA